MKKQDYLENCEICPRKCKTNRIRTNKGYCSTDAGIYIASIFAHKGEEPPISGNKGICNVFFTHCNLQCVYCQNYQISRNNIDHKQYKTTLEDAVEKIISVLETGIDALGFVSPSHFIPQMIEIIETLNSKKYFPVIVYNSNAYDTIESLRLIEKYVDVYLPDLKYSDANIAKKYSKAEDYPEVAFAAIKEMYRQKGDMLFVNKNGYAESGLIIRHLILPNHVQNSIDVLRFIARDVSSNVYISLMSQYYPTADAFKYPEISRPINKKEYAKVVEQAQKLGLTNGWIQELESKDFYRPDFTDNQPFKD